MVHTCCLFWAIVLGTAYHVGLVLLHRSLLLELHLDLLPLVVRVVEFCRCSGDYLCDPACLVVVVATAQGFGDF